MLTGCGYHCLRLCYLQLDELSSVADLVVIFGPVYEISKSLYSHTFDAFSLLSDNISDFSEYLFIESYNFFILQILFKVFLFGRA